MISRARIILDLSKLDFEGLAQSPNGLLRQPLSPQNHCATMQPNPNAITTGSGEISGGMGRQTLTHGIQPGYARMANWRGCLIRTVGHLNTAVGKKQLALPHLELDQVKGWTYSFHSCTNAIA